MSGEKHSILWKVKYGGYIKSSTRCNSNVKINADNNEVTLGDATVNNLITGLYSKNNQTPDANISNVLSVI